MAKQAEKENPTQPVEEIKPAEVIEEQTATNADDFFTAKQATGDVDSFIKEMKAPREKIDPPPAFESDDQDEMDPDNPDDDLPGESDEQMADHLDYTEEHKFTAEFLLIQIDKVFAFSFGMISGMDSDRYRRRKEKIQGNDYEVELGAALVKKYQMRLSLEWMFISAMVIGYAPMMNKAMKDRKEVEAKKQTVQPIKS
ncbi:MAG: hypothetical protein KDC85_18255 [Saprospiraceae bacterium]|nr:hypothetical protein [Saprospiraceae bacterium]MCB9325878.1 hypothetical protein [Lewinellaceae bacterium]